jgi:hypothetical protein
MQIIVCSLTVVTVQTLKIIAGEEYGHLGYNAV